MLNLWRYSQNSFPKWSWNLNNVWEFQLLYIYWFLFLFRFWPFWWVWSIHKTFNFIFRSGRCPGLCLPIIKIFSGIWLNEVLNIKIQMTLWDSLSMNMFVKDLACRKSTSLFSFSFFFFLIHKREDFLLLLHRCLFSQNRKIFFFGGGWE